MRSRDIPGSRAVFVTRLPTEAPDIKPRACVRSKRASWYAASGGRCIKKTGPSERDVLSSCRPDIKLKRMRPCPPFFSVPSPVKNEALLLGVLGVPPEVILRKGS